MEEKNIVLPVRNLSGTNAQQLQEDYITAMQYMMSAIDRFNRIEFHARDYSDGNNFLFAKFERQDMLKKMCDVYEYLETIAISLND